MQIKSGSLPEGTIWLCTSIHDSFSSRGANENVPETSCPMFQARCDRELHNRVQNFLCDGQSLVDCFFDFVHGVTVFLLNPIVPCFVYRCMHPFLFEKQLHLHCICACSSVSTSTLQEPGPLMANLPVSTIQGALYGCEERSASQSL